MVSDLRRSDQKGLFDSGGPGTVFTLDEPQRKPRTFNDQSLGSAKLEDLRRSTLNAESMIKRGYLYPSSNCVEEALDGLHSRSQTPGSKPEQEWKDLRWYGMEQTIGHVAISLELKSSSIGKRCGHSDVFWIIAQ